MKKILLSLAIIATLGAKAQSIGTKGGYAAGLGNYGPSWGAWVDGGKLGIEYNYSISNSELKVSNDFSNVDFSYYISHSFGITYKLKPESDGAGRTYIGGGLQSIYSEEISSRGTRWQKDLLPYISLGVETNLNEAINFRAGLILGKVPTINAGFGIRLTNLK